MVAGSHQICLGHSRVNPTAMTGNGFLGKRPKSLSSIFVNPMQIRSNWGLMFKSVNEPKEKFCPTIFNYQMWIE
jgi:hypothetical protein